MARIRSIKPEFFTSIPVGGVSRDARLMFVGLWTNVDDDGRWVDLATVPTGVGTGSTYAASVAVGNLLDRDGDLRVVIERDGGPPLVGRFWASDAAGPRVSSGPDDGG